MTTDHLLSCDEMRRADAWAMAHGVSGPELMARAGHAVAAAMQRRWHAQPVLVLCGPGNNGGDGYVAARVLAENGWPVKVLSLTPVSGLQGDALHHACRWLEWPEAVIHEGAQAWGPQALEGMAFVVDALFGAGLSRPLPMPAAELLAEAARRGLNLVAVDVPSGVHGDTGVSWGAVAARLTVTFFRKKPGHVLMPGRSLCGEVVVADIGIGPGALAARPVRAWENTPALWLTHWPVLATDTHKYRRGHVLVFGGARMVGAARLSARAAARAGAGLATLLVPQAVWPVYAAQALSAMVQPLADGDAPALRADWDRQMAQDRWSALVLGPGALTGLPGDGAATLRALVLGALARAAARPLVLDADALTVFSQEPAELFTAIAQADAPVVLTPHEGEFKRLFGALPDGQDKLSAAREAARRSGAVVLYKGADTVVAAPDGRAAVNTNAPPWLATAGSGDVLSGLIAGIAAQGVPLWEAACAAAWVHGACAQARGPGLLAEDLPEQVPSVLASLLAVGGPS